MLATRDAACFAYYKTNIRFTHTGTYREYTVLCMKTKRNIVFMPGEMRKRDGEKVKHPSHVNFVCANCNRIELNERRVGDRQSDVGRFELQNVANGKGSTKLKRSCLYDTNVSATVKRLTAQSMSCSLFLAGMSSY